MPEIWLQEFIEAVKELETVLTKIDTKAGESDE
jgi:hypothetical protein